MAKIWAAVPTPMINNRVNPSRVSDQKYWLTKMGIDGAFVCGTTGEFYALTVQERIELQKAWAETESAFSLGAHVGSGALAESQALAHHAEKNGFAMIAAVAPYYGEPPSIDGTLRFLAEIAEAAPETPFCYYHIPAFTGLSFDLDNLLARAVSRIPSLAAVKFTSGNLVEFEYIASRYEHLDFYLGADELLPAAMSLGADKFIGSLYNVLAPVAREVINLTSQGRLEEASLSHSVIRRMAREAAQYGALGYIKYVTSLLGPEIGQARLPWSPLSSEARQSAEQLAAEIEKRLSDVGQVSNQPR